jgi:hypothetical protein
MPYEQVRRVNLSDLECLVDIIYVVSSGAWASGGVAEPKPGAVV